MKKIPLMLLAMTPLVAFAGGNQQSELKIDKQALQQATPATAMLRETAYSKTGQEIGDVRDIVMMPGGRITTVLLDGEIAQGAMSGDRNQRAQQEQLSVKPVNLSWSAEQLAPVSAETVSFDSKQDRVTVDTEKLKQQASTTSERELENGLRVSKVVGMDVNLNNDESYGRVEEVMLSKDNTKAVALVVDSWDGLEKRRQAFPLDKASFDAETETVKLDLSQNEAQNAPKFSLDKYSNDGWDVSEWL